MDFMTTKQAAKLWGISQRRVSILCEQGRINSVKKAGIMWLLPPDSQKPKDARIKKKTQKVTGAVIINDKTVLIMRRAPGEAYAGFWEFPGGKVEEGETLKHCLVRELKEELGIDIIIQRFFTESIYKYTQGSIKLMVYIAVVISGEIKLTVHDKLAWANREDLLTFKLLPADISVAKKIVEELL